MSVDRSTSRVDHAREELGLRIEEHLDQLVARGTFNPVGGAAPSPGRHGVPGALAAVRAERWLDTDSVFDSLKKDLAQLDAFTAKEFYRHVASDGAAAGVVRTASREA